MRDFSTFGGGVIYRMYEPSGKSYVGTATTPMKIVIGQHKIKHRLGKGSAKVILDHPDWKWEILEEVKCDTRAELLARKKKWRDEFPCVNQHGVAITADERKERLKEQRNKSAEKLKEYYKQNPDVYRELNRRHHERVKDDPEYKQRKREYSKKWYAEKRREMIHCERCGKNITIHTYKTKHSVSCPVNVETTENIRE